MRSIPRGRRSVLLLVSATVATSVIALACSGEITILSPTHSVVHQCTISNSTNWPSSGHFEFDPPTECPITLAGTTLAPFSATAIFSVPSQLVPYNFLYSNTNRLGVPSGSSLTSSWFTGSSLTLEVDGTYYAATGGFDSGNAGFDSLSLQVLTSGFGWATAGVYIPYHFGFPGLRLNAPDSIGSGVPFIAHASLSDIAITPPVTYQWSVNGTPVSGSGPDYTGSGPTGGSMSIQVTSTDANSVQYTASHTVSGCSNNQIQC